MTLASCSSGSSSGASASGSVGLRNAGVGGEVKERVRENLVLMVAVGELLDGIMHVLIRLVLQFQVHNGQAVQEENEINLLGRLAGRGCPKVKMRAEGDAVLSVARRPGARGGPRLGVVEQQPHALLHFEAIPQNHPERFALQFLAQRLEDLIPRVRAVIFLQLFERVGLGGFEEGPEDILGDEMNMPSMFQHWSFCGPPAVVLRLRCHRLPVKTANF